MRNGSSIWYTTSSYSNTSVFFRPHVNEKPAFSKISTLERVFEKMRFGWPFSSDTCGRYAKADEKNLRFQAKRDTCGRGLNFVQHMFFYSSWVFQPSQDDPEDDYRTGCRNVSHCQQQSYSGLRSPGRSHSTYSSYILPYVVGSRIVFPAVILFSKRKDPSDQGLWCVGSILICKESGSRLFEGGFNVFLTYTS